MHKFIGAASRRTAGMAAGLILTGGLVGGVLLAPGTAYAAGTAPSSTTTTVSATAYGSTINATVSVTPSGATGAVTVSDGAGGGCNTSVGGGGFGFGGGGSGGGSGSCQIRNVPSGTYTVTATYVGSATYAGSSGSTTVSVPGTPTPPTPTPPTPTPTPPTPTGNAPAFSVDSPPTSVNGQSYSYQFQASNSPSFELVGAPSWLSIGANGMLYGNIPAGTTQFSYSVKAWNNWGWTMAGPFNVFFRNNYFRHEHVHLITTLSCTSPVYNGHHGTCTLTVTNTGGGFAPDVIAQINLPWQLKADYCGYDQFWNWSSNYGWNYGYNNGCSTSGNTATESLGSLYPSQTKYLTVTFTAQSGLNIWGRHRGYNETVLVTGSASSGFSNYNGNFGWDYQFFGNRQAYSVAYVTIIPHGYWWG